MKDFLRRKVIPTYAERTLRRNGEIALKGVLAWPFRGHKGGSEIATNALQQRLEDRGIKTISSITLHDTQQKSPESIELTRIDR